MHAGVEDVDPSLVHLVLPFQIFTVTACMCDSSASSTSAFCPGAVNPRWSWCWVSACRWYFKHMKGLPGSQHVLHIWLHSGMDRKPLTVWKEMLTAQS